MGLIDKTGKKVLLRLPDLKLISLARECMPYISVQADGLSFFFSNTDQAILNYIVENKRIWAKDEMNFVLGYLESVPARPLNVIDIGANVGTSVIYFRNMLGEDTRFCAVEPVTENFNLLNANCAVNGFCDIETFKVGMSEKNGEALLDINPNNMGNCKIAGTDNDKLVQCETDETYTGESVKLVTLDTFISENGIDIDAFSLFWIDVEGHEPEVFRGGMNTFRNSDSAVFCEFNPRLYKHNGRYDGFMNDIKECFGRFICFEQHEAGKYLFRDISEIGRVAEENDMNQCNLLLVK
ncbi:MAG: FkbM family methyltransferase [Saccharofermentans sp.]|nr:FkbM family methyltransferase [Saccharofermentans sp.]